MYQVEDFAGNTQTQIVLPAFKVQSALCYSKVRSNEYGCLTVDENRCSRLKFDAERTDELTDVDQRLCQITPRGDLSF